MPVLFADFWLADQWNSFANAFLDFHYLVAFYIAGGDWFNVKGKLETKRRVVNSTPLGKLKHIISSSLAY
jgi:hypothetical protein